MLPTRLLEKKSLITRNHQPPTPPQELNGRPLMKGAKITVGNNGAQ